MKDKLNSILKLMDNIKYGFSVDDTIYLEDNSNYNNILINKYKLKINNELEKKMYGICWDQVELERYYLEKNHIACESYFMICYDNDMDPTHTFIIVKDNNKVYWIEHSWEVYRGVHEYNNINDLFKDIMKKYKELINNDNIHIYLYDKPMKSYGCMEFYKYCEQGIKII